MTDDNTAEGSHTQSADSGPARPSRRVDVLWFVGIFILAFCLRAVYVEQLQACPFYGHEVMDSQLYDQWARAFAGGEAFVKGPYFRAPLYPWFLGSVYRLFGTDPVVPRIVQAVLGSLSCGLLFLIGRDVFGRRVGVLAGLAAATYWMFLYFDAELLIVGLVVFLNLLLIWLLLRAGERRRPGMWLASGIVLGLSAIARPNILLFAPAVLIWLIVLHRACRRRAAGYAACFILGCAVPIVPITVRNYVVGDDLVLISAQAGVNLYIGNNPRSDGMTAIVPGTPAELWPGYHATIDRAEKAAGRSLKASEVSGYYWGEALRFMREQPSAAAALMLKKLGYFWTRWEVSNNKDIRFVTENYTPIVKALPLRFWLVAPLGVLGLLVSLRQARRLFPLWGFVIIYMLGVVAFFVSARYRMPVVPVLILLGSHGLCWCAGALRVRRWRSVAFAAVVLAGVAVGVARVPEGVEAGMAQSYASAGIILAEQGRFDEAEKMLVESVERYPRNPKAQYSLGVLKTRTGDWAGAEDRFKRTLKLDPNYPGARNALGVALTSQGKTEQAIEQLRRLAEASPDDAPGQANLGNALIQQGVIDEGIEHFLRAIELEPASAALLARTAFGIANEGRHAEAVKVLRAALAKAPDNALIMTLLAKLLATSPDVRLRDGPEAVRLAERAQALTGGTNADVVDTLAAAYFAVGRRDRALSLARQAIEMTEARGLSQHAEEIRGRLRYYENAGGE